MAKIMLAVLAVLCMVVPVMAEVGGPCLPAGRLEVGYDVEYINRDYSLEGVTNATWGIPVAGRDYTMEAKTVGHYGTIAYGFTDQFEGKVYLGGADFDAQDNQGGVNQMDLDDGTEFSWGIGAKFTVPEVYNQVDLTLGGQYFATQWKNVTSSTGGVNDDNGGDVADMDVDSRMWNISLVASTEVEQFTPYIGMRYSNEQLDADRIEKVAGNGGSGTLNYESDNTFGGVVGTDIDFNGVIGGNVEVRFGDENLGVAGGINYKF